jgi:hypothetical protein
MVTGNAAPVADAPLTTHTESASIVWKAGCEQELRAALLSRLNDMIGTHLNRVTRTAISGPTQLDFYFPANYDLDRRQCDRPEVVKRLEQIIAELVGQQIRVRFLVAEVTVEPSLQNTPATENAVARKRFVENPEDPYLQEMMNVFGIQGWKIQHPKSVAEGEPGAGSVGEG